MTTTDFLSNPYLFSLTAALLAAVLTFGYLKTIEADPDRTMKNTFKVFTVVFIANLTLTLFIQDSKESLSTEPFLAD
jgi:hypothetical protein